MEQQLLHGKKKKKEHIGGKKLHLYHLNILA